MATVVNTPRPKGVNRIGMMLQDYKGKDSTLCAGCGHDAITSQIIKSFFEYGVEPYRVIKLSGIGCSSKTPAYFLNRSHGFNAVHGRMPAIATGAILANRHLIPIGVSGDGDTASIGMGQFVHLLRRNIPMIYIMENNGVYGLTKGQFSATADEGSKLKTGVVNELPAIDCCILSIDLGCGYVARSFAGDPKQLVVLLQGALAHRGTAFIDIISPCVTFNNHEGSTKSYKYAKDSEELLHEINFVPFYEQITVDYEAGLTKIVELHDGSHITLKKLERDYNPTNKPEALRQIRDADAHGEFLTGLIYVDPAKQDFTETLNMHDDPLATLAPERVRPSREALEEIMESLR
ncbi:MAG TPA: 2-oxoacid:ferredoxin oxidoreductase subunit beta [Acidobacteriota bacterium]|nr:2-oxoacid:ferredoxin oxidoreductase subunit beta [Acidobacteriota bacterium]